MGLALQRLAKEDPSFRVSTDQVRRDRRVRIDDRVGEIAARLVEQVGDVEFRVGQAGGDLADHVRNVVVRDRDAVTTDARQHGLGEVHRVAHIAVLEVVAQRVGHHDRAVLLRLARRRAEVRQRHDLRVVIDGPSREVADVGCEVTCVERRQHGRLVDDLGAGEIEDHASLAHQLQARLVDEATRRVHERHVHGDHVAAREQVIEAHRLLDARRQLPGALHGDLRIVTEHFHAQAERGIRDLDTDRPESHDAERAAGQLVANELLLALLHRLLDRVIVALERADVAPGLADVARREEQAREHQFLDRVRVRAGRVEHRDATAAQLRDGHVVGARAGARDREHALGNLHRVHVRRAQQDRVRVADLRGDLVEIARQPLEPADGDAVEREDLVGHKTRIVGNADRG